MDGFDLVIRNGTVATACETMNADIGIRDGRVVALGQGLARGRDEIDASGLLVLPGGVDAHCHLDQPMGEGLRMADDFHSGTRSAACGGTTTVSPYSSFCAPPFNRSVSLPEPWPITSCIAVSMSSACSL